MIVFGHGDNLRANAGQGRDYYDDQLPADLVARLRDLMKEVSPGLRGWVADTQHKFLFAKGPEFYEGMLCGLAMAAQLITDLSEGHPTAVVIYGGLRGLIGAQAAVVARHVSAERDRLAGSPKGGGPAPPGE